MPLTRLKRLSITFLGALGMFLASVALSPSGVQAGQKCSTSACQGCGLGGYDCADKICCDTGDLPCDEDDVWTEPCYGEEPPNPIEE